MLQGQRGLVDPRAAAALPEASVEVGALWSQAAGCAAGELPGMALAAGERPGADVEVLAGAVAMVEYELARRMHAASVAGSLPLRGGGQVLAARGWGVPAARRLARAGALAAAHPDLAAAWAAGIITADHVDGIARNTGALTGAELAAVIAELGPRWGQLSPAGVARFLVAAGRLLHPPSGDGPQPGELDAYQARDLSFGVLGDSVVLSGVLPRLEGEAVIAAVEALAERLRTTAEHTPAGARRADALVELVNTAAGAGALPTRGGLPVALSVTLAHTRAGDPLWATSRGHHLTDPEARFTACDPTITPILVDDPAPADGSTWAEGSPAGQGSGSGRWDCRGGPGTSPGLDAPGSPGSCCLPAPRPPGTRIAALAAALFDGPRIPLALGRTSRTATPAQRRALATRDRGCIIPGCGVPAENCQVHHLHEWADGGETDLDNCVLLCWAHHRQVDLRMWRIEPAQPQRPVPHPDPGAPPGTPWPGNHGAPWTIRRTPRTRWRQ